MTIAFDAVKPGDILYRSSKGIHSRERRGFELHDHCMYAYEREVEVLKVDVERRCLVVKEGNIKYTWKCEKYFNASRERVPVKQRYYKSVNIRESRAQSLAKNLEALESLDVLKDGSKCQSGNVFSKFWKRITGSKDKV